MGLQFFVKYFICGGVRENFQWGGLENKLVLNRRTDRFRDKLGTLYMSINTAVYLMNVTYSYENDTYDDYNH